MPKTAAMLWNERESRKPMSRDSIEYKNLHKDVINIENLISLHNLSILPHCLRAFKSLRPPFYGFINLNLILFPRFVFLLWHLGFFILPASYDLCNIVSKKRYNYCSAKFNSYFSIISNISRSLSDRHEKQVREREKIRRCLRFAFIKDLWPGERSARLQVVIVWTTLYTYWIYNNTIIMHTFLCSLLNCCCCLRRQLQRKNVFQGEGFQLNGVRFSNGERNRRAEET